MAFRTVAMSGGPSRTHQTPSSARAVHRPKMRIVSAMRQTLTAVRLRCKYQTPIRAKTRPSPSRQEQRLTGTDAAFSERLLGQQGDRTRRRTMKAIVVTDQAAGTAGMTLV